MAKQTKTAKVQEFSKKETLAAVPSQAKVGSARGIESMFRNSYRAQLDMIALAATKANIMISLNGFLVSMLLLSGTYLLSTDRLLLIPFALLLMTCTTAIFFAVLAARPAVNKEVQTLEDFRNDKADLLIFDQFSALSSEEYGSAMQEMMQDNKRVYDNMISHIYNLGCTADKKFVHLYYSYSAFIAGLIISVLALLLVVTYSAYIVV
ncbi:MAG: Pycsar system effector family protein [Granulosicoccus sp.]